ncbi:hypothetical protein BN1080_01786 [Planococcus massiliensis]|uniref:Polyketide cyclase / dehydrase and lipid transport n=1 Tax=Planococcus massiliensis TaxID=1499687 RepID=A0A098ENH2_9BACL|nr:SRPBCC family protein [Planococcus massiliensis]CEG22851.1 hypothetical protein BN1080_01786 [Planococcus massiliensis]
MAKWKKEILIDAPIEQVWQLFMDRNVKRIMPKVEEHLLLEKEDDTLGAKHSQSYYAGSQLESYLVETIAFDDTPERKHKAVKFEMSGMFEVEYRYTLEKVNDNQTKFIYEGSNKGTNMTGKAMLLAGSKRKREETVQAFMDRVQQESMKA